VCFAHWCLLTRSTRLSRSNHGTWYFQGAGVFLTHFYHDLSISTNVGRRQTVLQMQPVHRLVLLFHANSLLGYCVYLFQENCDMQTLGSFYNTDLLLQDTLNLNHYSDEECEILSSPMLQMELPRKKKYQPARQMLTLNKYSPNPGAAEIHVSEISTPATLSRGQIFYRHS